jgi:hypothetical protein
MDKLKFTALTIAFAADVAIGQSVAETNGILGDASVRNI